MTIRLCAVASGVIVANLYSCQPLLGEMARTFGVTSRPAGLLAALTQAGYGTGLVLIVPFGDAADRRRLVLTLLTLATGALVGLAVAPSVAVAAGGSFLLGAFSVVPQLLIPFAASQASPDSRGRVVGAIMGGLLTGILLARTLAGVVGRHCGWRAMYAIAAGLMLLASLLLRGVLPRRIGQRRAEGIGGVYRSVAGVASRYPDLREAAFLGAMSFGAFSAF